MFFRHISLHNVHNFVLPQYKQSISFINYVVCNPKLFTVFRDLRNGSVQYLPRESRGDDLRMTGKGPTDTTEKKTVSPVQRKVLE